jgi:signal transduction histidine kinase
LIAERTRELEVRGEQLEAKNAEISDFLYVVSHDLRAPLINLEGFSRALQENMATLAELMPKSNGNGNGGSLSGLRDAWPSLKSDVNESLDFILRGVAKMDFLVGGLLELSRIDSRPNADRPVDLNTTVDDVLGSLQFRIAERGIRVCVDPLPTVQGDPIRMSQVFSNLVDNAIKYMKPQGEAEIHIGCHTNGAAHHFFVRDTGIGIRAEDHARVFRLFTRVSASAVPGEGLGLTAVKKIIEKHEGRIWVESDLGQGSTFWFTLPKEVGPERRENDATLGTDQDSARRG